MSKTNVIGSGSYIFLVFLPQSSLATLAHLVKLASFLSFMMISLCRLIATRSAWLPVNLGISTGNRFKNGWFSATPKVRSPDSFNKMNVQMFTRPTEQGSERELRIR